MALEDVLSAPSSSHEAHVLSIVILVVSVVSAVGAGWIILTFAVSAVRTERCV